MSLKKFPSQAFRETLRENINKWDEADFLFYDDLLGIDPTEDADVIRKEAIRNGADDALLRFKEKFGAKATSEQSHLDTGNVSAQRETDNKLPAYPDIIIPKSQPKKECAGSADTKMWNFIFGKPEPIFNSPDDYPGSFIPAPVKEHVPQNDFCYGFDITEQAVRNITLSLCEFSGRDIITATKLIQIKVVNIGSDRRIEERTNFYLESSNICNLLEKFYTIGQSPSSEYLNLFKQLLDKLSVEKGIISNEANFSLRNLYTKKIPASETGVQKPCHKHKWMNGTVYSDFVTMFSYFSDVFAGEGQTHAVKWNDISDESWSNFVMTLEQSFSRNTLLPFQKQIDTIACKTSVGIHLISGLLLDIKRAQSIRRKMIRVPANTFHKRVTEILYNNGRILEYSIFEEDGLEFIDIGLKYKFDSSQPAVRVVVCDPRNAMVYKHLRYEEGDNIYAIDEEDGFSIVKTPQGIMADSEAKAQNIIGEPICYVR